MIKKKHSKSVNLPDQITEMIPELHFVEEHVETHCHNCYEIEVVIQGRGLQILNGQHCHLRRGSVTLLSPSDFHSVTPENGDLCLYNFMFRSSMFSSNILHRLWDYGGNRFLHFQEEDFTDIVAICQLLEREYEKKLTDHQTFMMNLMECLFLLLIRALQDQPQESKKAMNNAVQSSIQYLHQNYKENPSLTLTASIVNLNPDYFAHRFRKETGETYTEYLTKLKLEHAKKLLLSSGLSVTEICFASGFTSLSNFMKVFKKHTGHSPRQYARHGITNAQCPSL